MRPLWRYYYPGTQALIWVVDSNDRERLYPDPKQSTYFHETTAMEELHDILKEPDLENVVLLILANKQDLKGAMSVDEIAQCLQLNHLKNRKWHVQPTSGIKGEGIYEGLDWLINAVNESK